MAEHSVASEIRSVLIVTRVWGRDGGIATHVSASAALLSAAGVKVDVVVAQLEPGSERHGCTVHHAPRLLDPQATPSERLGAAAELRPDFVHMHEVEDLELVRALRPRAPVVVSVHGYSLCTSHVYYFGPGERCTRAHGPGCIPNLAFRGCAHRLDPRPLPRSYRGATHSRAVLRAADIAISHSSAVDAHLEANAVSSRAIVPLFPTITPAPDAERARRVVFAGRVVPAKGLPTLIAALAPLDAELVVCGEGWQLDGVRRLVARRGLEDRVAFRGWLPASELARELAQASVLALPSLWPEPFGLVGIEAMATGRPVVASATGGVADWLRDGSTGLLCRAGDSSDLMAKLRTLLDDPELRARMGAEGRRDVAARFTPQRHRRGLLDAYRQARARWSASAGAVAA
jgi:glycosyltransferase involved in cell wall biosynthesis